MINQLPQPGASAPVCAPSFRRCGGWEVINAAEAHAESSESVRLLYGTREGGKRSYEWNSARLVRVKEGGLREELEQ